MRNGVPAQASTNTASKPFSRKQTEPTLRHDELGIGQTVSIRQSGYAAKSATKKQQLDA